MVAVGIEDLKARLSEFIRAARAGETILVTDRGEVVAVLSPAGALAREGEGDSVEARLLAAEREGWVRRARFAKQGWTWRPRPAAFPAGTSARVLDALREDRAAE